MGEPANVPRGFNSLAISVQAAGNRLIAGDVGYRYLLRALADNGRSHLIFAVNNQSDSLVYGYIPGVRFLVGMQDGAAAHAVRSGSDVFTSMPAPGRRPPSSRVD